MSMTVIAIHRGSKRLGKELCRFILHGEGTARITWRQVSYGFPHDLLQLTCDCSVNMW